LPCSIPEREHTDGPFNLSLLHSRLVTLAYLGLALALTTQALAQDEGTRHLSVEHRKWLEEEVVYIVTDRERDVFLMLEASEDRQRFIEAFWKRRDPDSATPENEFRDEHYRRLEFANTTFSRHTSRPAWKTDQGRMYIILGAPNEIQRFETQRDLAATQLWFYSGDSGKGLPNFFVLLFYKPLNAGEYRLYSPGMDGPLSLLHGKEFSETNRDAIERLIEISPDLATASLTIDLGDPQHPDVRVPAPDEDEIGALPGVTGVTASMAPVTTGQPGVGAISARPPRPRMLSRTSSAISCMPWPSPLMLGWRT